MGEPGSPTPPDDAMGLHPTPAEQVIELLGNPGFPMPPGDAMDSLHTMYTRLRSHFGALTGPAARRPWWPIFGNDPPFEMLVGAVLVQQTRWETVEAAVLRLLEAELLSPSALAAATPEPLAALIRPCAFHRQKAPGLIAIASYISTHYAGSTTAMLAQPGAELRSELLALPRIGRETCDVIMLYGGNHAVFVVDEYTRRLFERVDPKLARRTQNVKRQDSSLWRTPYETVRQTIEAELSELQPSALSPQPSIEAELSELQPSSFILHPYYADFHAQINEVCVRYCLSRPRCDGPPARRVYSRQAGREHYHEREDGCPLRALCRYYREQVSA